MLLISNYGWNHYLYAGQHKCCSCAKALTNLLQLCSNSDPRVKKDRTSLYNQWGSNSKDCTMSVSKIYMQNVADNCCCWPLWMEWLIRVLVTLGLLEVRLVFRWLAEHAANYMRSAAKMKHQELQRRKQLCSEVGGRQENLGAVIITELPSALISHTSQLITEVESRRDYNFIHVNMAWFVSGNCHYNSFSSHFPEPCAPVAIFTVHYRIFVRIIRPLCWVQRGVKTSKSCTYY